MAKIYAELIRKGLKTLEDVPEILRSQVKKLLGGELKCVPLKCLITI